MSTNPKTVAYMRISDKGQEAGQGIEQQRVSIMAWARTNNVVIDAWVSETETGTTEAREEVQSLLVQAQAGQLQRLVIDRVDRLGRRARVAMTLRDAFQDAGVEVVFAQQAISNDPAGQFNFAVFAALAEYQRSEWLNRMKQCKSAAKRKRGSFNGGKTPIGFRSVGGGQLAVDDSAARMVRLCYSLRAAGRTLDEIVVELTAEGFRTKTGQPYARAQVWKILRREAQYRGLAVFSSKEQLEPGAKSIQPALLTPLKGSPPMHVEALEQQSHLPPLSR